MSIVHGSISWNMICCVSNSVSSLPWFHSYILWHDYLLYEKILRLSLLCIVWIWTNANMMVVCFLLECVVLKRLLTKILVFDVIMSQHKFDGRRLLQKQMGTRPNWSISGWKRLTREETGCNVGWPEHIGRKCASWRWLQVCKFHLVAMVAHGYKLTRCVMH